MASPRILSSSGTLITIFPTGHPPPRVLDNLSMARLCPVFKIHAPCSGSDPHPKGLTNDSNRFAEDAAVDYFIPSDRHCSVGSHRGSRRASTNMDPPIEPILGKGYAGLVRRYPGKTLCYN